VGEKRKKVGGGKDEVVERELGHSTTTRIMREREIQQFVSPEQLH